MDAMFNPFDAEIVKMYGPYIVKSKYGIRRRSVMFRLADGRRTSMSYARWQMTQHLGRKLSPNEHVDHVNEDALDDRIENYQILTPSENAAKHNRGKPSPLKGVTKGYRHGTIYAWMKKGCDCQVCKEAKRSWNRLRNESRRSSNSLVPAPVAHGTDAGYYTERRRGLPTCDECRAAHAVATRRPP